MQIYDASQGGPSQLILSCIYNTGWDLRLAYWDSHKKHKWWYNFIHAMMVFHIFQRGRYSCK